MAALATIAGAGPAAGAESGARWSSLAATVFHNYGRDQGLPHPVPTALVQDRAGFLWIGTQGGLARWDGYRFRTYRADADTPGSLPDDWVQTLHVDPAGRLWVGGGAGGLARYDPLQDRFVRVTLGTTTGRCHIGAIADDGRGGLWVGREDGLRHLDPSNGKVATLIAGRPEAVGLPGGSVQALLRDRTGALWVGTRRGLGRRAPGERDFTPIPIGDATVRISALFEDGTGRIWIGTMQRGLFAIDRPGAAPRAIGSGPALTTGTVSAIVATGPHEIWVGLRGNGVVAVDTATGQVRPIHHDRMLASSLAHDDVWSLLRDDAGSLWVGSTAGLSHRPRDSGVITTVFGAPERSGGLSASDPFAVLAAHDGRIWLGYLDGSADAIDPATGKVETLRPDTAGNGRGLPRDVITSLAEDAGGRIYFGTRRGLYARDRAGAVPHLVTLPGRDPHAAVGALAVIDGVLWIGGEEDGLRAYAGGRMVFGPADSAKFGEQGINVLRQGPGGALWVGTRDGLARVDLASHKVEHIAADPSDPKALPGRNVVAVLVDRQQRVWVGSFGGGLALMTGRDAAGRPRFRRFGLAEGLPHLNVDTLEMDGAGTIWAGTDDGLARIDPATLQLRAIRRADGSSLVDYFAGAGASSPAGEALFGAKGGLTIVRPGALPAWGYRPRIVVTDLRIGGRQMPVGRFNDDLPDSDPLVLTPEGNSLAVEFAALDFTMPERNRYAYRLDGFDNGWTETEANRRLAVYTNLPPGDYTLRLRGSNRDGLWVERDLALPIRVLPAWYQGNGFRIAVVVAFLFAIAALIRWRTSWLQNRQIELERQVADRTADLRAANDRLELLAMTDPLTGCANRRHFMARAHDAIALAQRHGAPLSLAVLDLDEFKRVNDSYGHPAGDAVLVTAGGAISGHVRVTDLVGRIGGEEFAVLMPHTAVTGAHFLADRLREKIGERIVATDAGGIRVTASIGVAELRAAEDFEALYARADAALYAAKHSGRNRVEVAA